MAPRILALIIKEFLALFRDKKSRLAVIVPPILQLLIFGYAATFDLEHAALAVLNELSMYDRRIKFKRVARGMGTVSIPARCQVVRRRPLIIVDSCHNPESGRALANVLRDHLPVLRSAPRTSPRAPRPAPKVILIYGSLSGKLVAERCGTRHFRVAAPVGLEIGAAGERGAHAHDDVALVGRAAVAGVVFHHQPEAVRHAPARSLDGRGHAVAGRAVGALGGLGQQPVPAPPPRIARLAVGVERQRLHRGLRTAAGVCPRAYQHDHPEPRGPARRGRAGRHRLRRGLGGEQQARGQPQRKGRQRARTWPATGKARQRAGAHARTNASGKRSPHYVASGDGNAGRERLPARTAPMAAVAGGKLTLRHTRWPVHSP